MTRSRLKELSAGARGTRQQVGIAIALITVIPALGLWYVACSEAPRLQTGANVLSAAALLALCVVLGYAFLLKYPLNVARLRRDRDQLEGLIDERTAELKTINEKLQLEVEERRRAERLKDEFVSTVSHELRTPLAITREGVCLLMDGIPGVINEKQHKVLASALGNIDRLGRIIRDLLDVSRIEAGRMQIMRREVDLDELVNHVVATMLPMARDKGLELRSRQNGSHDRVFADPDRIIQVLTNLVGNALKFTVKGAIEVGTRGMPDGVQCYVADTGVGIAEEDLPRLFHKFVQLKRQHGAGEKGTGLGLVIAKNIVNLHGGEISVETRENEGTTFAFALPSFTEEKMLLGKIDARIADARQLEKEFSLFICELRHEDDQAMEEAKREALDKAVRRLLQTRSYLRSTDALELRGERQVVLLIDVGHERAEPVLNRWKGTVRESLRDVLAAIPLYLVWGQAVYPRDGSRAEQLIAAAEDDLT